MKDTMKAFPWKIHPYSIIVTIVLDLFWAFAEVGFVASLVGALGYPCLVPIIFISCAFAVYAIQKNEDHDEPNVAWTKGLILGIFAAIPLSFTTLILGAIYKGIQLLVGGDKIWLKGLLATNWSKLEELVRSKAKNLGYKPTNGGMETMEDMINFLGARKVLSSTDLSELHGFRMDRNGLIHTQQAGNLWKTARRSEAILRKFSRHLA